MVEPSEKYILFVGNDFYYWELDLIPEPLTDKIKHYLLKDHPILEKKLFELSIGDSAGLRKRCKEYLENLTEIIPNLLIDENCFINQIQTFFDEFSYELTNLQLDKAREILKEIKNNYPFNLVYKKFLFKELKLEEEEKEFLTEIFEIKVFRSEIVTKKFIARFGNFIEGYNSTVEQSIKNFIMRSEEEFIHVLNILVGVTKEKIKNFISSLFDSFKLIRAVIRISKITPGQLQQRSVWENIYDDMLAQEEIKLSQVVRFDKSSVFICLSFKDSKFISIIWIKNFESISVIKSIPDPDTIVADGSTPDFIVLCKNSEKKILLGNIKGNKFCLREEMNLFSNEVDKIVSLSVLKKAKQLLYISQSRKLYLVHLPSKIEKRIPSMHQDTCYNEVRVSKSENFVILISESQLIVSNSDLLITYVEKSLPNSSVIESNELLMLYVPDKDVPSIKSINMSLEANHSASNNIFMNLFRSDSRRNSSIPELISSNLVQNWLAQALKK